MAASPSSPVGGLSDLEPASSPPPLDKSFMTNVTANLTEDEDDNDNDNDTPRTSRMLDTPEASDRHGHGGRGGGRSRGGRDSTAGRGGKEDSVGANGGGGGSNGLFKDPSAIGKIRHLKKEDGEPLWRADIQYDFLRAVFDDEHKVFTNSYEPDTIGKQCFADLYIDTMARSSKTSKILHDKLLSDRQAAKSMAMVCLLVNIGRMNTTLNFFPEMRAQLRTYHAIPSLQANQDVHDYKQLQDAPRLKSILKGGTEDRPEPRSLDMLKDTDPPRTNPVNLIFLICQSASKVAELHFPPGREFHDLIMKTSLSSTSRATAFLWIMWFYLESDFTEEGCEENPFGPGVDYNVHVANQGVPEMVELTPEAALEENQDTAEEREFGLAKKNLRREILLNEQFVEMPAHKRSSRPYTRPSAAKDDVKESKEAGAAGTDNERSGPPAILPRIRPSKHDSDVDSSRSTPPPRSLGRSFGAGASAGSGAGAGSRRAGPLKYQIVDGSSPARQPPLIQQLHQQQQLQQARRRRKQQKSDRTQDRMQDQDDDDADAAGNTPVAPSRKPRPPTAHQIAVENNRKQRIEYLLSRGMHRKHHRARKARRTEGAILRALRRLEEVEDPFEDSENEDHLAFNRGLFSFQPGAPQNMPTGDAFRERGFYGLVQLDEESDDFGEEIAAYAAAVRRACRRVNRWEGAASNAVVPPIKRPRVNGNADDDFKDPNETEEEQDLDGDPDMSMTLLEAPAPPSKRRRTAAGGASSRARGSRASKSGAATTSTSSRRRRPAAAAASKANEDVTMNDVDDADDANEAGKDAIALASGVEAEAEAEADIEADEADEADVEGEEEAEAGANDSHAATPSLGATKPRVTIKKVKPLSRTSRPSKSIKLSKSSKPIKTEDDDREEVERAGEEEEEQEEDNDDDEELNDMDKTLLGMGDGDTDSE